MTRHDMRKVLRTWGRSAERRQGLEEQLQAIRSEIEDVDGLHAQNMDGMPRGSGVGRPVEAMVFERMRLEERYADRMAEINREIEDIDRLDYRINRAISLTLTDRQAEAIREVYQNCRLPKKERSFEAAAFRMGISTQALRRLEIVAINKITEELC